MHRHFCEVYGHDWQCGEDCNCLVCGLPMNGFDHSDCPVELRPCPEHKPEQERRMAEAMSSEADAVFMRKCHEPDAAPPHCNCGCAETESSKIIGWCLHCDHVYVDYSPDIEALHFANSCPGVPEVLKQAAWATLAKRQPHAT